MYDENGSNLSEQLFQKELYTPAGQEMWKKMASAHWLQDGRKDAPIVLYIFADPFCPYCAVLAAIPPRVRPVKCRSALCWWGDQAGEPGHRRGDSRQQRSGENPA